MSCGFEMRKYVKLLRIKHYMKNLLVFIPLFFAQDFFCLQKFGHAVLGFFAFCMVSSAVYIMNDIRDADKDRMHPTKRKRPIASGDVKERQAFILLVFCIFMSVVFNFMAGFVSGVFFITAYFVLNLLYSFGLKDKPLVDIAILTSGFVIRVFYGAVLTDTVISGWLYLVIVMGSFYMGLGKRRNEMKNGVEGTRTVLKYYTYDFLDKNMYVCAALIVTFYALWTMELEDLEVRWTIPVFMVILMKYSLDIEDDSDGDPVEVLMRDKALILLSAGYVLWIFAILYLV